MPATQPLATLAGLLLVLTVPVTYDRFHGHIDRVIGQAAPALKNTLVLVRGRLFYFFSKNPSHV